MFVLFGSSFVGLSLSPLLPHFSLLVPCLGYQFSNLDTLSLVVCVGFISLSFFLSLSFLVRFLPNFIFGGGIALVRLKQLWSLFFTKYKYIDI